MDTRQRAASNQAKFEIFVPSCDTFIVLCNGQKVENYRELMDEARQFVEPLLRERWANHWSRLAEIAHCRLHAGSLEEVMRNVSSPDMHYPCPATVAEKAKVPGFQRAQQEHEAFLQQRLETLYGPLYRYGDHKIGDQIRFRDRGRNREEVGTVIWVKAPCEQAGLHTYPLTYIVDLLDPWTGFPSKITAHDIIA